MRDSIWLSGVLVIGGLGCGGSGDTTPHADASPVDANTDVVEVSCESSTIAATVTTAGLAYSPVDTTIAIGDVVELAPLTGHDVVDSHGAFHVPFGGDLCFRFDAADSYTFHCSVHSFSGTLTVQ